jgi:hypothetical protein
MSPLSLELETHPRLASSSWRKNLGGLVFGTRGQRLKRMRPKTDQRKERENLAPAGPSLGIPLLSLSARVLRPTRLFVLKSQFLFIVAFEL